MYVNMMHVLQCLNSYKLKYGTYNIYGTHKNVEQYVRVNVLLND